MRRDRVSLLGIGGPGVDDPVVPAGGLLHGRVEVGGVAIRQIPHSFDISHRIGELSRSAAVRRATVEK